MDVDLVNEINSIGGTDPSYQPITGDQHMWDVLSTETKEMQQHDYSRLPKHSISGLVAALNYYGRRHTKMVRSDWRRRHHETYGAFPRQTDST